MTADSTPTASLAGLQFRDATEADVPRLLEIYNDVVLTTTAIYENEARTLAQHLDWFRHRRPEGFRQFVATIDDAVVGYCGLAPFRTRACYASTVELHLHLMRDYRGRGLGSKMLDFLIGHARESRYHVMIAGIDAANTPSLRLHAKHGFKITGELPQVAWKFDRWLDLTFMQLVFGADVP